MEVIMRITLDIDSDLLEQVLRTTEAPSRSEAVEIAMKEFLRTRCREGLSKLIENYEEFDLTLKELEKMRIDS
jgi:Arc/MetJ family transcription regulator